MAKGKDVAPVVKGDEYIPEIKFDNVRIRLGAYDTLTTWDNIDSWIPLDTAHPAYGLMVHTLVKLHELRDRLNRGEG